MANLVEREGEQIQAYVGKKAERILEDHGFTTDGSLTDQEKARSSIEGSDVMLDHKVLSHVIEELNRGQEKEKQIELSELNETFEDPNAVKANISIDDVCCKKQKVSGRKKGSLPKEKREMVYNTVAHIQNKDSKTYTLNTSTISQMMIVVLAFRLSILPGESGRPFRYQLQVKCAYEDYIDYDIHRLVSSWFSFDYFFLQQNHLKRVWVKIERKREFLVSNF